MNIKFWKPIFREYKEALKQQRNHDVYKPKNNQSKNIFEINENVNNLPEEGNNTENILVNNGNNKNVFPNEDAIIVIPKKPVQKVIPSRNVEMLLKDDKVKPNGDSPTGGGYVKPSSPMKTNNSGGTNGILTTTNNKFSLPNPNKSVAKSSSKTR